MTENDCFRCLQAVWGKECHFCDPKNGDKTHRCTGHPHTRSKLIHGARCPAKDYNVRSKGLDCLLAGYPIPVNDMFFGGVDPDWRYQRVESEHPNGHGMAVYKTNLVHPASIVQYEKDLTRETSIILVQMLENGEKDVRHLKEADKFSAAIDTWIRHHFVEDAEEKKEAIKTRFSRTVLNGALILHALKESMQYPADISLDMRITPTFQSNKGLMFPESGDAMELMLGTLLRPNTLIRYEDNSFRLESTQVFSICTCDTDHQTFAHVLTTYESASDEIAYQIKIIKKDCTVIGECKDVFCHDTRIQCNSEETAHEFVGEVKLHDHDEGSYDEGSYDEGYDGDIDTYEGLSDDEESTHGGSSHGGSSHHTRRRHSHGGGLMKNLIPPNVLRRAKST